MIRNIQKVTKLVSANNSLHRKYCFVNIKLVFVGFLYLPFLFVLSGCYASGQKFYDMYQYSPPTSTCQVIWVHSFDNAKYKLDNELPSVTFLGSSSFSTSRTYNEETARKDCMAAGGDYVIVVDRGFVGSTQSQFTMQSTKTYTANNNTNYYGSGGYYGHTNSTTSYQVPTYQTYNVTENYYGFSYYVYQKNKNKKHKRNKKTKKSKSQYVEDYDEDL